jgi:hypothetical protein
LGARSILTAAAGNFSIRREWVATTTPAEDVHQALGHDSLDRFPADLGRGDGRWGGHREVRGPADPGPVLRHVPADRWPGNRRLKRGQQFCDGRWHASLQRCAERRRVPSQEQSILHQVGQKDLGGKASVSQLADEVVPPRADGDLLPPANQFRPEGAGR